MSDFWSEPDSGQFDHYGRYLLDDGTGQRAWTRVTTMAKTLEDTTALTEWKTRQVAIGVGRRQDLAYMAATHYEDKAKLKEVVESALEAAETTAAANLGTSFHGYRKLALSGGELPDLPELATAHAAYVTELTRLGITEDSRAELTVTNRKFDTAGTFDGMYRLDDGTMVIGDIKTGSVRYPQSFALQMAAYASAEVVMVNGQPYDFTGQADQIRGLIIEVDVARAWVMVHEIDLTAGLYGLALAQKVRQFRKRDVLTPYVPTGLAGPGPAAVAPVAEQLTIARDLLTDSQPDPVVVAKDRLLRSVPSRTDVDMSLEEARGYGALDDQDAEAAQSDVKALINKYRSKSELQAAAKSLSGDIKLAQYRHNLATDMVSHPSWPEHRSRLLDSPADEKLPAVLAEPPAPWVDDPEPVAAVRVNSAEDDLILAVSEVTEVAGLAKIWDQAMADGGPGWTSRLDQAAQVQRKMIEG
jgi:hypothetical protein